MTAGKTTIVVGLTLGVVAHGVANARQRQPRQITVQECGRHSLEGWLAFQKQDIRVALGTWEREKALYYPFFDAHAGFERSFIEAQTVSEDPRGRYTEMGPDFGLGFRGKLPIGGDYEVGINNAIVWSSQTRVLITPQFRNRLYAALTQPILRNAGVQATTASRDSAKHEIEVARYNLVKHAEYLLFKVSQAYWLLYRALARLSVIRKAVDLAQQHRKAVAELPRRGKGYAGDRLLAETMFANVKEMAAEAEKPVLEAEYDLLMVTYWRNEEQKQSLPISRPFQPTDRPRLEPETRSLKQLVRTALSKRPEVTATTADLRAAEIEYTAAEQDSLPKLDLVIEGGLKSFVGLTNTDDFDPSNPEDQAQLDRINDLIRGQYGDAWKQVFTAEFPYVLGKLVLEIPTASKVRSKPKDVAGDRKFRAELTYLGTLDEIEVTVRDGFFHLKAATRRYKVAQNAFQAVQRRVTTMIEQMQQGEVEPRDVLTGIEHYIRGGLAAADAAARYMIARARVEYTVGDLRQSLGVEWPDAVKELLGLKR